jgi:hypothetical protein
MLNRRTGQRGFTSRVAGGSHGTRAKPPRLAMLGFARDSFQVQLIEIKAADLKQVPHGQFAARQEGAMKVIGVS